MDAPRSGEKAFKDDTLSLLLFIIGLDRAYGVNLGLEIDPERDADDADLDIDEDTRSGRSGCPVLELTLALLFFLDSIVRCWLKWFLIALSGRPGRYLAISAHFDPIVAYIWAMSASSSGVQSDLLTAEGCPISYVAHID